MFDLWAFASMIPAAFGDPITRFQANAVAVQLANSVLLGLMIAAVVMDRRSPAPSDDE